MRCKSTVKPQAAASAVFSCSAIQVNCNKRVQQKLPDPFPLLWNRVVATRDYIQLYVQRSICSTFAPRYMKYRNSLLFRCKCTKETNENILHECNFYNKISFCVGWLPATRKHFPNCCCPYIFIHLVASNTTNHLLFTSQKSTSSTDEMIRCLQVESHRCCKAQHRRGMALCGVCGCGCVRGRDVTCEEYIKGGCEGRGRGEGYVRKEGKCEGREV